MRYSLFAPSAKCTKSFVKSSSPCSLLFLLLTPMFTLCTLIFNGDNCYAQSPITIEDIYYYDTFYCDEPNAICSSADGEHYTVISGDSKIEEYSFKTGQLTSTLIDLEQIEQCPIESIDGYEVSSLGTHILIYSNIKKIYRHSFYAKHYIYDIRYKTLEPLSENEHERDAMFSPNGAMVAYVYDNDIFIKKLRYNSTSAVTTDGEKDKIINGAADWVYEEEFVTTCAMAWSLDSRELAFLSFDESKVSKSSVTFYNSNIESSEDIIVNPSVITYKYPRAGETNSKVSVKVYNVENRTTKTMQTGDGDYYLPRITWTGTKDQLAIVKINRRQNELDMLLANTASTVCKSVLTDREDKYIEESVLDNYMFLPDETHFLYTGELDGYRHIYLFSKTSGQVAQLTKGNFDVTALLGYDEKTKRVFFQAAKESPLEREIYSVSIDKKIITKLSSQKGTNKAFFNSNYTYFVNEHSSANTPPVYTLCNASGQVIRTLVGNEVVKENMVKYNYHKKEFFTFNTSNGTSLNGWMVRPKSWDNGQKYPLLIVQYNGPDHQEVLDTWDLDWEQALAAEGYIVVCVDTRGTGARGEEFRKCTYQKLGKYETDDLIEAAKWLGSQSYVDADRIGIWGWSYGGMTTCICMCKSDLFKMGIAVAALTNWRYYDTVYAERFMRKPDENISGYTSNNPLDLAKNLHGRLFLIHGAADDNVLLQNHADMVTKLIENNKQFDTFVYPNKNHSIYGGNTRNHLYTMMFEYVKRNL